MQPDNAAAPPDPGLPAGAEAPAATGWRDGPPAQSDPVRSAISEWTVTILLLIFGTTTLVQAFVIPTGSMEDNLLIGDHLLVDKLAYAPAGPLSRYLLPYTPVRRGDIIVFRYPVDLKQTFVKRVIGIPGDRIRLRDKQVWLKRQAAQRSRSSSTKPATSTPTGTTFRPSPTRMSTSARC